MTAQTPARVLPSLEMIEAMTACAYQLGMAVSEIALKAGEDTARLLAFTTEFRHCFFAVRMGIRLSQAGVIAPRAAVRVEAPERERSDAAQRPERDDAHLPVEADRERDSEPLSLPQFLKTLGLAAAKAEQARDVLPAHVRDTTLPTLQTLLRQTTPEPTAGPGAVQVLARPPKVSATRSHLLGSVGASGLAPRTPLARLALRRPSG